MASTESLDSCQADPQVNYESNNTLCCETGLSMPLHDTLKGTVAFIPNMFFTQLILCQIPPESIPVEIVFVILSLLGPKDLLKVSLLNSFYPGLSRDDALWKSICSSWGIDQGTKHSCWLIQK